MPKGPNPGEPWKAATFRPSWWTDAIAAQWEGAARLALLTAPTAEGRPLSESATEEAIALGFAARRVYPATQAWDPAIETRLKREWDSNGPADTPWARAARAVRHGWDFPLAASPGGGPRR
jgi:hypothetical protein